MSLEPWSAPEAFALRAFCILDTVSRKHPKLCLFGLALYTGLTVTSLLWCRVYRAPNMWNPGSSSLNTLELSHLFLWCSSVLPKTLTRWPHHFTVDSAPNVLTCHGLTERSQKLVEGSFFSGTTSLPGCQSTEILSLKVKMKVTIKTHWRPSCLFKVSVSLGLSSKAPLATRY